MEEGCDLTVWFEDWEDGVLEYLTVEMIFKLIPERWVSGCGNNKEVVRRVVPGKWNRLAYLYDKWFSMTGDGCLQNGDRWS